MKQFPHSLARQRPTQTGFSLIETLMVIGIISTAVLGTLGLLAGSMSASQEGYLRSRASVIAQDLFHDLQLGAWDITPHEMDERLTRGMRPVIKATFARQVLFYDPSGILLSGRNPGKQTHQKTYDQGLPDSDAAWLVSVEGFRQPDFTSGLGGGQVLEVPDTSGILPLGNVAYPYAPVNSSSDPSLAPPVIELTQVHISIEAPPSAPKNRRKKFSYDFYWSR